MSVCLFVCLSVRPDVCPVLLAHLTDFVWLTITFKHCLGMLATIWTNFCYHSCPAVHMRGRTDTFLGSTNFWSRISRAFFYRLPQNFAWLGVLVNSISNKILVNFGPLFRGTHFCIVDISDTSCRIVTKFCTVRGMPNGNLFPEFGELYVHWAFEPL